MPITLEPIRKEQKSVFIQLMELYNYDFSLYSGDDVNEYGYYGYDHIDDYGNEEGRFAYFIRVADKLAGLVLVRTACEFNDLPNPRSIAEFFVLQKYRRQGVGKAAAILAFDKHPGDWEVSQFGNNLPAQQFWQAVIAAYTGGNYQTFGPLADAQAHVGFTFTNA